jgi:hypothetical protein
VRYNGNSTECEELAVAFGTKFLIKADLRDRSFRNYASGPATFEWTVG